MATSKLRSCRSSRAAFGFNVIKDEMAWRAAKYRQGAARGSSSFAGNGWMSTPAWAPVRSRALRTVSSDSRRVRRSQSARLQLLHNDRSHVAKPTVRLVLVGRSTTELNVRDSRLSVVRDRHDVMELQEAALGAATARRRRRTGPLSRHPDGPSNSGWNVPRSRRDSAHRPAETPARVSSAPDARAASSGPDRTRLVAKCFLTRPASKRTVPELSHNSRC